MVSMDQNVWLIVLITLAVAITLRWIVVFLLAGGDTRRIGLAIRSSLRVLRDPALAARVEALLALTPKEDKPPKPSGAPLRFLTLLQREGRLVDFLLEDMQGYPDNQIGAAVRDIHRQCAAALKEHLVLEPVLPQAEGDQVEVPAGFDPAAIQLTGNVTGQPPFRGTLRHHGWRVKDLKLAPLPPGQDEFVLQPAEVELP
jgi:Domain of unknown function (DUF2760)